MTNRVPPSSAELIRKYSKARVLVPSTKKYVVRVNPFNQLPELSVELDDRDVVEQLVRKFG